MVARAARDAGIAGLAFFSGIPGAIGGALRMNGGAYGGETKDVLVEARGVDRQGNVAHLQQRRDGLCLPPLRRRPTTSSSPRRCFRAAPATSAQIAAEMDAIKNKREASQPRNRTGGSTFKNPPGHKRLETDRRRRLPRA